MKRILAFLIVIGIFLLAICPAFADGSMALTILSENYIEYKGYSDMKSVYLAKIQNNTDQGYYLTTGTLILKDANGTIYYIGSESMGMNSLGANNTFIFLHAMTKDILTYVEEKGITLTQVEALAFAEDR